MGFRWRKILAEELVNFEREQILAFQNATSATKNNRFKNFLQNFGDESQFGRIWDFGIDFKILKKSCDGCTPILGPILEKQKFGILFISQSYNKPPWRNFDSLSNFEFCEI